MEMQTKSFQELITNSTKPVLVDFWAEWCGPCRMVSPVVERIAREYSGRLTTVKVNVDEKQHVAVQYNIRSIPTIMMFWKGQVLLQTVGAQSFESLKQQIDAKLPVLN